MSVISILRKSVFLLFFWIGMPFNHFESQVPPNYEDRVGFELYETVPLPVIYDEERLEEVLSQINAEPDSFRYKIR